MALSPEDVIKKSFSATHLRRGYDETQVDDFLDEVVVELRRMLADQDDLIAQLEDCRSGKYDGGYDGGAAAFAGGTSLDEEQLAQVRREREELVAELEQLSAQLDSRRAEVGEVEADANRRVEAARQKAAEAESQANEQL
ncbi:MAG TPA: DivIVA domain-containing protein, partial [Ornithinicoccus sp.]|nr:DivIVA domain-containing protein [Ornithinicoccus sp.]